MSALQGLMKRVSEEERNRIANEKWLKDKKPKIKDKKQILRFLKLKEWGATCPTPSYMKQYRGVRG